MTGPGAIDNWQELSALVHRGNRYVAAHPEDHEGIALRDELLRRLGTGGATGAANEEDAGSANAPPGAGVSFAENAATSAGLGIPALLSQDTRDLLKSSQAAHPWASAAGTAAGAIPGAMMPGAAGMGRIPAFLMRALMGAGQGASGNMENPGMGAATGAAANAVVPEAIHAARGIPIPGRLGAVLRMLKVLAPAEGTASPAPTGPTIPGFQGNLMPESAGSGGPIQQGMSASSPAAQAMETPTFLRRAVPGGLPAEPPAAPPMDPTKETNLRIAARALGLKGDAAEQMVQKGLQTPARPAPTLSPEDAAGIAQRKAAATSARVPSPPPIGMDAAELEARTQIIEREGFPLSDATEMAKSGTQVPRSALEKILGHRLPGTAKWI